jgi:uncharacterized repeat protein (TIGR02543 family)
MPITADLTLTAKWMPIEYIITYYDGWWYVDNPRTFTIESADLAINPPEVRDGYTFDGWFANADFSGEIVTYIPAGSTGNKEFWAKWTEIDDNNNGEGNGEGEGNVSLTNNVKKSDKKHGVLLKNSIVSDKAEMFFVLPNKESVLSAKIVIYDNVGNVVFETAASKDGKAVWNLTNAAGRNVANGTYLVVAEVKGNSGKVYAYSTKIGVKR